MAERRPSLWVMALLIVVVLVAAGVAAGWLYERNRPGATSGPLTVQLGDNVTVNYIGLFGNNSPEEGRVFDTSLYSVAVDNSTWPKALQFAIRGNATSYGPLGVHVGPSAPSGGYSLNNTTFGSVVTGFWQGLIGLEGNHTRWLTIPPNLGYGALNQSCLVQQKLVYQVPLVTTVAAASFASHYPNITDAVGTMFTDPTYGWTDLVLSLNATSASVENLPPLGFESSKIGWPIKVTNISGGNLTITNDISPADIGRIAGHSATTVCSTQSFIVSGIDVGNGTFTENFNREVVGQTLIFGVTVVGIYP